MKRDIWLIMLMGVGASALILSLFSSATPANAISTSDCTPTVSGSIVTSIAVIDNDCVIVFKSGTGTWTVPNDVTSVRVLIVGGGGGGGNDEGGGGGAGGFIEDTSFSVTQGSTVAVTVGSGGSGSLGVTNNKGENGANSIFGDLTAIGGGGGGSAANFSNTAANQTTYFAGNSGGSGGGGKGSESTYTFTGNAGAGTAGQGSNGGAGGSGIGGGGGGANAAGSTTGAGGAGKTSTMITTTIATSFSVGEVSGSNVYFAAGGGGGRGNTSTTAGGTGGLGGGGNGGDDNSKNSAGQTNTGGGGGGACGGSAGGCGTDGKSFSGASGGSGVVIIRFTDSTAPSLLNVSVGNPSSGSFFKLNDYISITATYDEPVIVSGSPLFTFSLGGTNRNAQYLSGSGSSDLIFRYQVTSSDLEENGISVEAGSINLNSGSMRDNFDNNANRSYSLIAASASRKVDGVVPTAIMSSALNNRYSSRQIRFTIDFSETVTGFDALDTASLKVVVGSSPNCAEADNSTAAGWTKQATTSTNSVTLTLTNPTPQDANLKACVTAVGVVDQAGNALSAVETSLGLTRATQVTRWIKYLWGEDLERF